MARDLKTSGKVDSNIWITPPSSFNVISWNTKSLCLMNDEVVGSFIRAKFLKELLIAASYPHVIALQEMPIGKANGARDKIRRFLSDVLEACRDTEYGYKLEWKISAENMFLVRNDLEANFETPLNLASVNTANCHPLTISVSVADAVDPRKIREYLITSVHSPSLREFARKANRKLLKTYAPHSRAVWEKACTSNGARDISRSLPVHIICGDFNEWMRTLKGDVKKAVC